MGLIGDLLKWGVDQFGINNVHHSIKPYIQTFQAKGYSIRDINNGGSSVTLTKSGFFGEKVVTVFLTDNGKVSVIEN